MLSWTPAKNPVGLIYPTSFGSFTEGWLLSALEQPHISYRRVLLTEKDDLESLTDTLSMKPSYTEESHVTLRVSSKHYTGLVRSILNKGFYNPNSLLTISCGDYFLYKELQSFRPSFSSMTTIYLHSPLSLKDLQGFAARRPDFTLPNKFILNLHKLYGHDLDLTWKGITLPQEDIESLPDYSGSSLLSLLGSPPPDLVKFTVTLLLSNRSNPATLRKVYQQYTQLNLEPLHEYSYLKGIYSTVRDILEIKQILPENRRLSGRYARYTRQIGDIPLPNLLWFLSNPHHTSLEHLLLNYFNI